VGGGTVEEAIKKVNASVKLPIGYTLDWSGEYESQKRSERRLLLVLPLAILLIYIILYSMFKSVKWALLILTNVAMARIGGLLALLITLQISVFPQELAFSPSSVFPFRPA
jgi:heavy metal efflux system protein